MPFDGTHWPARQERPRRPAPGRGETIGLVLIAVLATLMLLLPVSLTALIDLVGYLRAG